MSKFIKNTLPYLFIILLGAYAMWDLTTPGLHKTHDSISHIVRILSFQKALDDGQIIPRWAPYLFEGIGSPVLILNYLLPYFFSSAVHGIGFSFIDSFKITLALSFILSGITAYFSFKSIWGKLPGLLAAMIYTWAPFRFVDIYVRGAFGEAFSFIFPPLILLSIHKKWWLLLTVSFTGLLLSHPVASALFCLFFFPYMLIYYYSKKDIRGIFLFFASFILALGISAFNVIPSIFETGYTKFSPSNTNPYVHFPTLSQLINSPWGYGYSETNTNDWLSFKLGLAQWSIIIFGCLFLLINFLRKTKKRIDTLMIYVLAFCFAAIIFMLEISAPLWKIIKLERLIDLPWRINILIPFLTSFLGAWILNNLQGKFKYVFLLIILFLSIYGNRNHLSIIEVLPHSENYYITSYQTGDDGGEYATIYRKTTRGTRFDEKIEVVKGDAKINITENKSHSISANIKAKEPTDVMIYAMYFPGWKVWLDNKEFSIGKECNITKSKNETRDTSGLILCQIPKGDHMIHVEFTDTPLRTISNLLSFISVFTFICLLFPSLYRLITKRRI